MTPQPTLRDYRELFALLGGEDHPAVKFLDEKIKEYGEGDKVLADPHQMMILFAHLKGEEG